LEQTKNIYGKPHKDRMEWLSRKVKIAKKAEFLFFVGCAPAYTRQEIAQSAAKIFNAAGVDFMISENEACCGYYMFATGQIDQARKLMDHNLNVIRELGVKMVVTSCAACYKTLKVDYPKLLGKSTEDLGFKVLHVVELLDQLVRDGRLKFRRVDMRVTYHDPCQLGRLSEPWIHWEGKRKKYGILEPPKKFRRGTYGVYDPPRNIIKSIPGIELVEMERIKENAWCCGAGGGVKQAFPDFAQWTATERLEEAKTTGAENIITACPFCKENLEDAIKAKKEKMKVYDITELIAQALEG